MKAFKLEVLAIDFEDYGEEAVRNLINRSQYVHCEVKSIEGRDIGEWSDDHPLNSQEKAEEEYKKLFS